MNRYSWIIICLAYIVGLLTTGLFYFANAELSLLVVLKIGLLLLLLGIVVKFIVRVKIDSKIWLSAILIAILAVIYFSWRIPQPSQNDISNFVLEKSQLVTVRGRVLTEPRLNSSNKIKLWLQANEVAQRDSNTFETVTGKLYVTLPLLQGNNIYPRQFISIEGNLYRPQAATNPTQFDFQQYLRERGTFAGLTGYKIIARSENKWGWYRLRKRIIRAQVKGLGSPLGQLVSSMVLGRKAVDLPDDIRNLFIKSGLAHVLAASGFHVSLLLGITLKLTNSLNEKKQAIIGAITLLIYLCLTGFSPSVIRAVIMGFALIIAIASKAKVRPLGSLLLAATLILLINPLWIWDLGFQLSFLATLGLIVTLPNLESKLDWLPSSIATAIAIPLAASIWVLPLISYVFNTVATYSIIVNLIATPLIAVISLGGMFSSAIALIIPNLGSNIAWLLKYPTLLLIAITQFFTSLPSSTWAIGTIPLWLLLFIYSLISLICFNRRLQKKWWLFLICVFLIVVYLRFQQFSLVQITILDNNDRPAIVIQDRGQVILVNNSDSQTVRYTIVPFLASQGINQIDYLIVLDQQQLQNNLSILKSQIAIKKLAIYDESNLNNLSILIKIIEEFNPTITTKSLTINKVDNHALQLKINNEQWLLTDRLSFETTQLTRYNVLLWLGKELDAEAIEAFSGIAIANNWKQTTLDKSLQLYATDRHGTIIWQPKTGFTTMTEEAQRNNTLW